MQVHVIKGQTLFLAFRAMHCKLVVPVVMR